MDIRQTAERARQQYLYGSSASGKKQTPAWVDKMRSKGRSCWTNGKADRL